MRVVKVLNNSLVLALDEEGRETILMGKGIGFHKASGYEFGADEVEKVFVLRDRSIARSIIRLAAETDSVYFEIGKNVIDYAKDTFDMKLLDHIYLSLTDHLAFAVRRVEKGILVPNFYTQDMHHFNPNEFQVGHYALKLIKEQIGVELPEDTSRLLYDQIAQVCTSEFSCVERLDRFVGERFGVGLTNQESMYLALHIHRVLEGGRKDGKNEYVDH